MITNLPALNGATRVENMDELNAVGTINNGFGLRANETIEFQDEKPQVYSREIQGSTNKGYYFAVVRNGKAGYMNVAELVRVDADRNPVDELRGQLREKDNFLERYAMLAGKTAKTGKIINYQQTNFVDGKPAGTRSAHTYELTLSE